MKVIVQVTKEDLTSYEVCMDEIKDWFEQALRHSVDTWDGGLTFLDGFAKNLEIQEVQ